MKILLLPDTQAKPGVSSDHMEWAGRLALEERPDVIVHLGDHWDFPSLSSYEDAGSKVSNRRDILDDIEAGNESLARFDNPLKEHRRTTSSRSRYKPPRKILLKGNHDGEINYGRVHRALLAQPHLRGFFEAHPRRAYRWEVVPFLQPIEVGGIHFCHYFCRSADGRVKQSKRGQPSAKAQLQREGMSCVAGHQQGLDVASRMTGRGRQRSIIAGSFYLHEEPYLTPQGNGHWQGVLLLHHVKDGDFDLEEVSMAQLRRRFS